MAKTKNAGAALAWRERKAVANAARGRQVWLGNDASKWFGTTWAHTKEPKP